MDPGAGNFGWGAPQQQQPQQMHGDGSGAYGAYPSVPLQGSTSAGPYDTYHQQHQQPGQYPATGHHPGQYPATGHHPGQYPATGHRPGQYPATGHTVEHYPPQHLPGGYPSAGDSYAYPGSNGDPSLPASSYHAPPPGYPGAEQQQAGDEDGDRGLEHKLNMALHKKHKIFHPIDHAKWKLGAPARIVKKTAQLVGLKRS